MGSSSKEANLRALLHQADMRTIFARSKLVVISRIAFPYGTSDFSRYTCLAWIHHYQG